MALIDIMIMIAGAPVNDFEHCILYTMMCIFALVVLDAFLIGFRIAAKMLGKI